MLMGVLEASGSKALKSSNESFAHGGVEGTWITHWRASLGLLDTC